MLLAMSCVAHARKTDIEAIQRTYRELRRYALPDDQTSETREIPPRIRLLQTRFKHQLRDLIAEVLEQDAVSISRPRGGCTRILSNARFRACLGL